MITIRLHQGLLFYVYNFVIPLVIPSLFITIIGIFFDSNWQFLFLVLLTQIYLFNTVMLSTNIGLLNSEKNKKKPFVQENTGISLCFVWINLILLLISLAMNFSEKINDLAILFLSIISILLVYVTLFLISKNESVSFAKVGQPKVGSLTQERDKQEKEIIKKILKRGR